MRNIVMLLSNPFRPDPRVLKEAVTLQNNGFNLTILCWDRQSGFLAQEVLPSGVKIVRIHNITSSYGIGTRQLRQLLKFWIACQSILRNIHPQIIHCHDFDTLPAGLWFGILHRVPVIYDAHEYYADLVKPRLHGLTGKLLFALIKSGELYGSRISKSVVTVDDTLAKNFRKYNRNVVVLGHYPELCMVSQDNCVFTKPDLTLIYTGRLSTDRGMLTYVDILRKLLIKGIPVKLLIAGVFTPESEKTSFYDYAKDISESIHDLGWVQYDQLPSAYREADIGLAIFSPEPRYVAATPVKLFDYMANGLPVIASNFPPIAQVIRDANCGMLIDSMQDITKIVGLIEDWWHNKSIPQALGENGRQAVISKYNWEIQAERLVKLYQNLT